MIILKTSQELSRMREAGRIAGGALAAGMEACKPGVTTMDVNRAVHQFITSHGAKPSFLGYGGFPASACVSVNNEVIHGIPSKQRILREGDIVSIDVGAFYKGYHGDTAATVGVGSVSAEAQQLMDVTARCLELGIAQAIRGNRIGDIGAAVQQHAESFGYGVVREFIGHGVGAQLHEDPEVPNYGRAGRGPRLAPGMTIAIEPMINLVGEDVEVQPDGWTVLTASGSLSAHFEHTIAITDNGPVVLTTRP
ncbi:MAG: type I methionyl aminopeptidase [Oscillospiraceae bacterium]|nr:type I methionyl aminopeptidase [Oscillospiraceae bacterium]